MSLASSSAVSEGGTPAWASRPGSEPLPLNLCSVARSSSVLDPAGWWGAEEEGSSIEGKLHLQRALRK